MIAEARAWQEAVFPTGVGMNRNFRAAMFGWWCVFPTGVGMNPAGFA